VEQRVYGLENEYAILYEPAGDEPGPLSQRSVYSLLELYARERFPALPARGVKGGIFLGNGSLLHYEARLERYDEGLAEFNTPECSSPRELCVYHRAIDEILREALPVLRSKLAAQGYHGRLSFAKANVDRAGHTFGASENYFVDDPLGTAVRIAQVPGQTLFTVVSTLVHGLALLPAVLGVTLLLVLLVAGVLLMPVALVASVFSGASGSQRVSAIWDHLTGRLMAFFDSERTLTWLGTYANALFLPIVAAYSSFARLLYLRRFQRWLVPFLVSRTAYAGTGRVDFSKGTRFFRISARADFIRTTCKVFWNDRRKPILDIKHLFLDPREPWRRRKRLTVLYSDSHLCDEALLVAAGVTGLVLEAVEAGAFAQAPEVRLASPLGALHDLNGDPLLATRLRLVSGEELSATDHQRRYLAIVRDFFSQAPMVDLEKLQLLRRWEEMLDTLDADVDLLFGRVDWVTKRRLIEEVAGGPESLAEVGAWAEVLNLCDAAALSDEDLESQGDDLWLRLAEGLTPAALREVAAQMAKGRLDRSRLPAMLRLGYQLRKVDLKYHDLDPEQGYAALLAAEGEIPAVASPAQLETAREMPPPRTRARARGLAVARAARAGHRGKAGWRSVVDYDTKELWRLPNPLSPEPRGAPPGDIAKDEPKG
jgi:hypothetical protein